MPKPIPTLYAFALIVLFATPALAVYDAADEAKASETTKTAKSAAIKEVAKTEPATKAKAADKALQDGKKELAAEPSTAVKAEKITYKDAKDAKAEKELTKGDHEKTAVPVPVTEAPATVVTETPPALPALAPAPEKKGFWGSLFGGSKKAETPAAPTPATTSTIAPATTSMPEATKSTETSVEPPKAPAKAAAKPAPVPMHDNTGMNIVPQGDPFNLHSAPIKP